MSITNEMAAQNQEISARVEKRRAKRYANDYTKGLDIGYENMQVIGRSIDSANIKAMGMTVDYAEDCAVIYAKNYAEGCAKGRAEVARQIAQKCKAHGLSLEAISECTELSIEEVEKL